MRRPPLEAFLIGALVVTGAGLLAFTATDDRQPRPTATALPSNPAEFPDPNRQPQQLAAAYMAAPQPASRRAAEPLPLEILDTYHDLESTLSADEPGLDYLQPTHEAQDPSNRLTTVHGDMEIFSAPLAPTFDVAAGAAITATHIVIGSFTNFAAAKAHADRHAALQPAVTTARQHERSIHRVVVGPVAETDAKAQLTEIRQAGISDAWVLRAPGRIAAGSGMQPVTSTAKAAAGPPDSGDSVSHSASATAAHADEAGKLIVIGSFSSIEKARRLIDAHPNWRPMIRDIQNARAKVARVVIGPISESEINDKMLEVIDAGIADAWVIDIASAEREAAPQHRQTNLQPR